MHLSAKNQSIPSLPQTRIEQDGVQLYTSVDNRSTTTLISMFHGITYDRQPTICLNVSIVGSKMKQQAETLRSLTSTDWGYVRSILRTTNIATASSIVEYAAAAWPPWVRFQRWRSRKNVRVCWKSNHRRNQYDSCRNEFS